jgi:hypothetical protein
MSSPPAAGITAIGSEGTQTQRVPPVVAERTGHEQKRAVVPGDRGAKVYLFKARSGKVVRQRLSADVKDINELCAESKYLTSAGCVWFVMHPDNDLPRDFSATREPTNRALQASFPASRYVGDILVVKTRTADSDVIDRRPWKVRPHLERYTARRSSPADDSDPHLFFTRLAT